jgi:phosphatidylserine decarboxylase
MARSDYPLIAQEGWPPLSLTAIGLLISLRLELYWLAVPLAVLLVLLFLLFRDPRRDVPAIPLGIVSPVDGTVVSVEETAKGILDRAAVRFIVKVNSLGAYTARSPMGGSIMDLHEQDALGTRLRGQGGLWVHTEAGDDMVLVFRGSRLVGRPKALVRYGERIGQGQRVAYLRLADYAEIYLPVAIKNKVQAGQLVRAGVDILAELVHEPVSNGQAEK